MTGNSEKGLLYRCGHMSELTDQQDIYRKLKLRTIIDLRRDDEVADRPPNSQMKQTNTFPYLTRTTPLPKQQREPMNLMPRESSSAKLSGTTRKSSPTTFTGTSQSWNTSSIQRISRFCFTAPQEKTEQDSSQQPPLNFSTCPTRW